jgi:hypothetical protein
MVRGAIRGKSLPKYLSSDHDPLYRFHPWKANLRVLDVTEIKTVPYLPLSHALVEPADWDAWARVSGPNPILEQGRSG